MDHEKNPIVTGLVALVSVALAVGLVLGVAVLGATKVLGIGGSDGGSGSGQDASLYLPEPVPTTSSGAVEEEAPAEDGSSEPAEEETEDVADELTLQAAQSRVAPWERIDFSGTWPAGEGELLRMERRLPGGPWTEFEISHMAVSGGRFATYLLTGQSGVNQFRVAEVDGPKRSNVVKVTIG